MHLPLQHQLLCFLVSLILTTACVSRSQFDAAVASRDGTERDLQIAQTDLNDTKTDLDEVSLERDELDVLLKSSNIRVRDAEARLEERGQALNRVNDELSAVKAANLKAREEQVAMTQAVDTALKKLSDQLKAIEESARKDQSERNRLADELANADASLAQTKEALQAAQSKNATLSEENNRLNQSLAQVRTNIRVASEKHSATSQELQKTQAALAQSSSRATRLQTELTQSQASLEAIQKTEALLRHEKQKLLADNELLAKTTRENEKLVQKLNDEIGSSRVKIRSLSGRVQVDLPTAILFPSGTKSLSRRGKKALSEIAQVLSNIEDRVIRVYGHTDNVPVNEGASYGDNLGLSALRASQVVSHLVSRGIDPKAIAPVGLGEHFPVEDNETKRGRAANRRIEIVLIPKLSVSKGTPLP